MRRSWLTGLAFMAVTSVAVHSFGQGAQPPPPPPPPPPADVPPPPPPAGAAPAPAPAPAPAQPAQPAPGQPPPPGAYGQQGAPPPPPPGYYGYPPAGEPPPPPVTQPVGVHEHDGFFLRFGIGYSYLSSKIEVTEPSGTGVEGSIKGSGVGIGLAMIGGTVAPGFVLGGALLGHGYSEPEMELKDAAGNTQEIDTSDETLTFSVIGLFAQYYFDPKDGGYLQALIGFGQLDDDDDDDENDSDERPSGAVFGIGGGYDFWVGEQWSLGPELRLMYAPLKYEESAFGTDVKIDYDTTVFSLMFTATHH